MLKVQCDRCKKLSLEEPALYGIERNPMAQAGPPNAGYHLVNGWQRVLNRDLCPFCVAEVEYTIKTIVREGQTGAKE